MKSCVSTSTELERALLGSMLISREAFEKGCGCLRVEDFGEIEHQIIFSTMQKMFRDGTPCDNITLMDALGTDLQTAGGITYITKLSLAVPSGANAAYYINGVMSASGQRHLVAGLQRVLDDIKTGADSDYISDAQSVIDGVKAIGSGTVAPVGDKFLSAVLSIGAKDSGLKTGFLALDTKLRGLKPGHMTVIGARPSMGKTSFGMNIAVNVAMQDKVVAAFSLEMNEEDIVRRAVMSTALYSDIDAQSGDPKQVASAAETAGTLSKTKLYVIDDALTVDKMKARCYAIRQQEKALDLVVIDYLGLIQGRGKSRDRVSEVSEISRSVKLMARELNVPVLILSQLSRNPEQRNDHRPMLSDLRESGAIEQDADEVLFLYRPAVYDTSKDEKEATVIIAKNRNGRTGECNLLWDGEHFRFYEHEIDFDAIGEDEQICM